MRSYPTGPKAMGSISMCCVTPSGAGLDPGPTASNDSDVFPATCFLARAHGAAGNLKRTVRRPRGYHKRTRTRRPTRAGPLDPVDRHWHPAAPSASLGASASECQSSNPAAGRRRRRCARNVDSRLGLRVREAGVRRAGRLLAAIGRKRRWRTASADADFLAAAAAAAAAVFGGGAAAAASARLAANGVGLTEHRETTTISH